MNVQATGFSSLTRSSRRCFAVPLLALAIAGACDRMPLTAPSGTAISLMASPNVLPVNGAADVTAVLIEGGAAASGTGTPVHNGTVVTFSTTLGRIEPGEAQTSAGKVVVRLVADGRAGKATITAFSGAARQTLEVTIGEPAAQGASVSATPASLRATRATGAMRVTARATDSEGAYRFPTAGAFTASARVAPTVGPSTTARLPVVVN